MRQVRHESHQYIGYLWCEKGAITGSGNSVILLLRIFKYRNSVHSEKRAGNVEILL